MKLRLIIFSLFLLFTSTILAQEHNLSNGNVFEGEPFIAINPTNPQNIVVVWQGFVYNNGSGLTMKVKASFNGGTTWSSTINMPHIYPTNKSADPSMAFDDNGNLFLSYIDYHENPDSGAVYLLKSTNGGLNWGSPVKMIDMNVDPSKSPIDRPWLSVNGSGNKLYLTTKPAPWISAPNRPYFTASTDGGNTWPSWRYLDTINYLVGSMISAPMAAPACYGNTFYAIYPSYVSSQNVYPQFILAKTNNSGASFSYKTYAITGTAASNDSAKLAYKLLIDPTDTLHLVILYPNAPYGDIDVMMIETMNAGTTWSTPIRINDDAQGNGKMQDMIWASFDTDGDMIVTWRDHRNASGTGYATASEFYAAYRYKDSAGFATNFKLSDSLAAYNTILEQNGNDFMSSVLRNDTLYAVYANTRNGSLNVWFVKKIAHTGGTAQVALIESENSQLNISPNPSSGIFYVTSVNNTMLSEIKIFDLKGALVYSKKEKAKTFDVDLSHLPNGIYSLTTKMNGADLSRKIVLSK